MTSLRRLVCPGCATYRWHIMFSHIRPI